MKYLWLLWVLVAGMLLVSVSEFRGAEKKKSQSMVAAEPLGESFQSLKSEKDAALDKPYAVLSQTNSDEMQAQKKEADQENELSLEDLASRYLELSPEEILVRVESYERDIAQRKLIESANSGEASVKDRELLQSLMRHKKAILLAKLQMALDAMDESLAMD